MKRSDKIIIRLSAAALGALLYLSDRVARQVTDPDEARQYRVRQALFSAGASVGGALLLRTVKDRLSSKIKEAK